MNLKKISLLGFKSFAEKSEMVITKGITTLVGPNGCGKSNLVDAVRWVLGEQSIKMLRGGKTEDVIFNGCESRKALGMAEVTLTFDNTSGRLPIDYNEVSITRRLFRSGESVYLINKTQCRLKDIHQLLVDTGVGTSSYSIIEQGKMDWVINAKPSERREIFEEAAGIVKYKNKRKEATRRLKYANENLIRLRDIIQELETQRNSVSRQAAKAKRFKKLSNKLKLLDCQNSLHKFESLSTQIKEYNKELQTKEKELEDLKKEVNDIENHHQDELELSNNLDEKYKLLTEKKFEQEKQLGSLKQSQEYNRTRIDDIKNRLTNADSDAKVYEQKSQELAKLLEEFLKSKEKNSAELERKQEELEDQEIKTNKLIETIEDKKKFIYEYKEKLEDLSSESSENQQKIIESNLIEKNLEQQIEKQSDEISDIQLTLNFEEDQYQIIKEKATNLKTKSDEITASLKEKEDLIKQNNADLQKFESNMLSISTELSEKISRKDTLEDLKNSYEGFFTGVKAVMLKKQESPDEFEGIIGVVPDVIKVHSGYEIAAEAALGSRIQNIIVKTGENAKKAIEFLKKHKIGRVTFLPLDLVRGRNNLPNSPQDSRILGKLTDFIDYEEQYNNILSSLLGNYLVADNLHTAINLMREGLKGYNIITLQGELISGSGAITGGEIKNQSKGFFSRENEIDELDKRASFLREELIKKNEERSKLKNLIERTSNEVENLKIKRSSQDQDYQHSLRDLQKTEFQRESMQKRINMLYVELEKAQKKLEECLANRGNITKNIEDSSLKHSDIQQSIANYETDRENSYDQLSEEKEHLSKLKFEFSSIEEKTMSLNERIKEVKSEKAEREEWLKNLNSNQNAENQLIDSLKLEIESNNNSISKIQEDDQDLIQQIESISEEISNLKNKTEDFENRRKNATQEIEALQEQSTSLKVHIAEFEGKINNLKEHLFSKYQLRIEEVEKEEIDIPWEEVPEQVSSLETRVANLGNVNLEAIEELERLEKRFEFLTNQEKDLNSASKKLHEVIKIINERATEMFNETFDKVKVYFSDIYHELFEGGKAELKLMESEDFLEAGIDIIARPPGKNSQTISLLSGGEKALTATALLFALFKIKPSPFCIIDELDAPLDDTNISRFTKMLIKFSNETQFIVITHNKNTLKIADLLYGVTQPVKGISTFISVKFIDDNLDHLLEETLKPIKSTKKRKTIMLKEDESLSDLDIPNIKELKLKLPEEENKDENKRLDSENAIPQEENQLTKRISSPLENTSELNERNSRLDIDSLVNNKN